MLLLPAYGQRKVLSPGGHPRLHSRLSPADWTERLQVVALLPVYSHRLSCALLFHLRVRQKVTQRPSPAAEAPCAQPRWDRHSCGLLLIGVTVGGRSQGPVFPCALLGH